MMKLTAITAAAALFAIAGPVIAQVNPDEILDPELKALEKTYLAQLRAANTVIAKLHLPFTFQLNRYVGSETKQQAATDTRGLEFVKFHDQVVLKVTGNYNAAYNAAQLTANQRAGRVVDEVISPALEIVSGNFSTANDFAKFGFEISFHVRQRGNGFEYENKQIVVLVLDRQDALAYTKAHDTAERQQILDRSEVYLDGKPYGLLLGERDPFPVGYDGSLRRKAAAAKPVSKGLNSQILAPPPAIVAAKVPVEPTEKFPAVGLDELQKSYQLTLDRLVQEKESQAHFVSYAPPAFINFHNGVYLQVSVNTTLTPAAAGSQYRLTALAFDQHIAHLIRPVLAYFKDRHNFDGIDFSTTVRLGSGQGADGNPLSAEFIFPLKTLNSYADFDLTGQQLIDASFVLINGERVSLNLQTAEAGSPAH
jgi:hypothetical protein